MSEHIGHQARVSKLAWETIVAVMQGERAQSKAVHHPDGTVSFPLATETVTALRSVQRRDETLSETIERVAGIWRSMR